MWVLFFVSKHSAILFHGMSLNDWSIMKRRSITIKGGGRTRDLRLDRVTDYDERSRMFGIAAVQDNTKPLRSYTWRCNESFNQGNAGSCVAHAVAHELVARPSEVKGLTSEYIVEQIYWEAQKIDPWSGGSYPGAYPQYEGTSILAGAKIAKKLGWIEEYRWAFNVEEALRGLGYNGPAIIGIRWTEGMMTPDANGFIHPVGRIVGGHAILARAVNIKQQFVTLKQSWEPDWGKNGDCYLSFEDFANVLNNWGECCFFKRRTINPN